MQNLSVVNSSKMETGDEKRMKQFTYVVTDEIGIHGPDEDAAYEAMERFFRENL